MGPRFPTGFLQGEEHIWTLLLGLDHSQLLTLGLSWTRSGEEFLVLPPLAEGLNPLEWDVLSRPSSLLPVFTPISS